MTDLIDTTEMYLRTIYELEEEGIVPLRARIAERLLHAGPTVSQTVTRMERDGLLTVEGDRHLELTELGRAKAMQVMRKHRLAERLLIDVIGLDWEDAHNEACRWEHVMSEQVERKILDIISNPSESPYGNPIPGLDELRRTEATAHIAPHLPRGLQTLDAALTPSGDADGEILVEVRRISEQVQKDEEAMGVLRRANALPGRTVNARLTAEGIRIGGEQLGGQISDELASHIFVSVAAPDAAVEAPVG